MVMKKLGSCLKVFALLLLATLLGCVIGYAFASAQGNMAATRWQQIPDPPERPVQITYICGSGRESLFVETILGRQYECCGFWPKVWQETTQKRARTGDACPDLHESPLDQWSGKIVDCAYVMQWEWATERHYVVLLEDGSLWRWRYYTGVGVLLSSVLWGALAGFILGVVVLSLKGMRR